MPKKKRSRLWLLVEILAFVLATGALAYAWTAGLASQEELDTARAEIALLEAASAEDSVLLDRGRVELAGLTDTLRLVALRLKSVAGELQACLAVPPDTFPAPPPDTVPGPERIVEKRVEVSGPTVYLPGDTVWMPGEITIREVKTGRGWPHWTDAVTLGVGIAACLIVENTGGSETVNFGQRDDG